MPSISRALFLLAVLYFSSLPAFAENGDSGLAMNYYNDTCPQAKDIIKEQVQLLYKRHKNTDFSWLRNIFRDCFVGSCNAPLLLDSTRRMLSENETDSSFGMRNFRYIETIKEALERECPGVVSRADSLVLSARDGIVAPKNNVVFYGPWGGPRGSAWNDGSRFTGVRQIILRSGNCIDAIRVTYDLNGSPFQTPQRGGNGGSTRTVQLQFPYEFLVGISGFVGYFRNEFVVRSLTFTTNLRRVGPFGVETGTPFNSPLTGVRVVGFSGRSGIFIDQIGVFGSRP